jgi:hypothetical protein
MGKQRSHAKSGRPGLDARTAEAIKADMKAYGVTRAELCERCGSTAACNWLDNPEKCDQERAILIFDGMRRILADKNPPGLAEYRRGPRTEPVPMDYGYFYPYYWLALKETENGDLLGLLDRHDGSVVAQLVGEAVEYMTLGDDPEVRDIVEHDVTECLLKALRALVLQTAYDFDDTPPEPLSGRIEFVLSELKRADGCGAVDSEPLERLKYCAALKAARKSGDRTPRPPRVGRALAEIYGGEGFELDPEEPEQSANGS